MPIRLPRPRITRRRLITAGIVVVVLVGLLGWAIAPTPSSYTTTDEMVTVLSGPRGDEPVKLDTTLYLPRTASAEHQVPAILLAHGFGGTKRSVASDAQDFADRGYAVLTWTARGMGASTGEIHLDSPDYEVRDAQRLIDRLAARPDIALDASGDPRVGVVGGSYGGALALMLAGQDRRVDAIVPMITWNDLANAFLPESTGAGPARGVFKKQWAGLFFGQGGGGSNADLLASLTGAGAAAGSLPAGGSRVADPQCGRFAREVCAAYLDVATTGSASTSTVDLLRRSSPAPTLSQIKAPTLLIQGQADSLFPLTEGEANYRAIAATGTPVRVDWFTGGHDGGNGPRSDQDRLRFLTITWLDYYLLHQGDDPGTGFTYSRVSGFDADTRRITTSGFSADGFPDSGAGATASVALAGPPQRIANPPDGNPAAITTLPGTGSGSFSSLLSGVSLEIPGQHADFYSEPVASNVDVVGTPTVAIRAASASGEAVLFVKLYDVDPDSGASLPFGLTSPVRLTGLPPTIEAASPVTVQLPGIVYRFETGHRLRITIASSDQAFTTPVAPAVYTVALGASSTGVTLPTLAGEPIANPEVIWRYLLVAVIALVGLGIITALVVARVRRRRNATAVVEEHADTPLVVRGLRKEYADGFVAVSSVDFTVQRGQVVGLLGPNGAGKTTSLRVLLGMTRATKGEILIFGHHLRPGAEVLGRVGALVEGPGFLPHLSGVDNLRLYWRATGRPEAEARLDEALDIAGLGDAIHRKVRKYSHGMKQRLAIAQAMLGMPELLVLDEPTDGLDPPQIAEMRRVLHAYATDGRAVLVSSHLLAEVEQTCTHVVVMHKGTVVANGPVDDVVGDSPIAHFEVSDVPAATEVLDGLDGIRSFAPDGTGLMVDIDGTPRTDVVAALVRAGVGVDRVVPRRRLEDAFLTLVGGDSKASGER
jgi:ABC-2 type transport system ATP-binding protein